MHYALLLILQTIQNLKVKADCFPYQILHFFLSETTLDFNCFHETTFQTYFKFMPYLVACFHAISSVNKSIDWAIVLMAELQNFKEIGKDSKSLHGNSVDSNGILAGLTNQGNLESNSSDQFGTSSEAQVSSLRQYVKVLESKLEETSTTLEAKGSNISQLKKTIINCTKSTKEDLGSTVGLQEIKCRDIENEVECLFKQKIEAEVEYLAITRTVQNFKYIARKPTLLFEEQEAVAEQQAQMLNTLLETESKAVELEKRAKEMKNNYGDSVGTGEDLVTVGRLGKVAWCFVLQLLLLILVIRSFVSENLSHSRVLVIVPT